MDKSEFYEIVANLIIPLFTGSFLAGETESSSRDNEVALGKSNSILLKPTKMDDYRIILKRGQAFKSFEVNLIRSIIHEINQISALNISDKTYLRKLHNMAIEKALVESITDSGRHTDFSVHAAGRGASDCGWNWRRIPLPDL